MIVLSDVARADLRAQLDYLDDRSPKAAQALRADLDALLADLDARAFDGPSLSSRRAKWCRGGFFAELQAFSAAAGRRRA